MNYETHDSFKLSNRWFRPGSSYRCESAERSRGLHRRDALRSYLGATGSNPEESLDSVLAALIREGDAFEKWREGREALRNPQVVQRTRGVLAPIATLHADAKQAIRIGLARTADSQLEVWECGDDFSLRFPVFRLPLSSIEHSRTTTIKEKLRPGVFLKFDITHGEDGATVGVCLGASDTKLDDLSRNFSDGFGQVREIFNNACALLSTACELLRPAVKAIVGFRSEEFYPWQCRDIRNDRLYQLGDMFRPAMSMQ